MKKFECKDCYKKCQTMVIIEPKFCLLFGDKADWHEVKEVDSAENAQTTNEQFGNSEQLPDWVKVGAVGYDGMNNEYFEVIEVNNDSFRAKSIGSSDSCSGLYFNEFCSEARKRPLNADEMKALVGRLLTTVDGDVSIATVFDNTLKELWIACKCFKNKELANSKWLLDGKPCYKLEHLENGEWVE